MCLLNPMGVSVLVIPRLWRNAQWKTIRMLYYSYTMSGHCTIAFIEIKLTSDGTIVNIRAAADWLLSTFVAEPGFTLKIFFFKNGKLLFKSKQLLLKNKQLLFKLNNSCSRYIHFKQ